MRKYQALFFRNKDQEGPAMLDPRIKEAVMIKLTQIDETNFLECLRYGWTMGRSALFIPIQMAQAYVYRTQCMPFGIYPGQDDRIRHGYLRP
jgi:hypothetical protein